MSTSISISSISAPVLLNRWDDRSKFLTPASSESESAHSPWTGVTALYKSILDEFAAQKTTVYHALLTQLAVADPDAFVTKLFSNPPTLILAPGPSGPIALHIHTSREDLADYIFVSLDTWSGTMGRDPFSRPALIAHELVKAAIVHELGRCLVASVIKGSTARSVYESDPSQSNLLTPEKIRVPWVKAWVESQFGFIHSDNENWDAVEAGYWVELNVLGGLIHSRDDSAYLQTSPTTSHQLTHDMLLHARNEGIVNYASTFTFPLPDLVSSSPSTANSAQWMTDVPRPQATQFQSKFCPGPFPAVFRRSLSPEEEQELLVLARALAKSKEMRETEDDENPMSLARL